MHGKTAHIQSTMKNNFIMKKKLKLFVWEGIRRDYTAGIDFAMAYDIEEARQKIKEQSEDWEWEAAYLQKPSVEMIKKQERAYNALLAYEKNCLKHEAKYINPQMAKIPKGERMNDFAMRYGTTIKEMKDQWRQVESALANGL